MSELIVGIDLGTTNSVLAVSLDGKIKVIELHGQPTMPSCVGLDAAGRLIAGQAAKNQLVAAPESTILSIKRRMGEETRVPLGDRQFSPEELSSFILREIKLEGERQLGREIKKAVITVPAFFNDRQRKATQSAGDLAGLEVVRIINEPTAAALAYGAGRTADERMLVYDLGGGTFDVSVVVVEQGVVEVKASHGDTRLGGDDFDQLLVERALREFKSRHGADLSGDGLVLRRLKVALEQAKCRLSDEPFVAVREEFLDGRHHLEMEIAREEYEEMIARLLEKTLVCIHQSLQDANFIPKDINKVMLVGGSTRTPLVHRLLRQRMQLEPRWEISPDLIVAMGAAIQGANLAGEASPSILVDITPHTFSTTVRAVRDGIERLVSAPVIPRNTPLPASKAEVFYTQYDHQEQIDVDARQGESPLPEGNTLIGDFRAGGLSRAPAGNPIVIHFDLDLNGILKVTALEKNTGVAKTVTMDTRGKPSFDLEEARRNIAALTGGPEAAENPPEEDGGGKEESAEPEELLATAKDLRKRGEALLAKSVGSDDAEEVRALIHQSAESVKNRDWAALAKANETLGDLVFYLED